MDSATLKMSSSNFIVYPNSSVIISANKTMNVGFNFKRGIFSTKACAISPNGFASSCDSHGPVASSAADKHKHRSNFESLFCYDKAIPEERIEKPVGLSLAEKMIGDNPRCTDCQAKGAVLCTTCAGSGLYVDSILESQGIIVKVRCLVGTQTQPKEGDVLLVKQPGNKVVGEPVI